MSIFSGKFHKLPGVRGELTDRTPELRATMEQVDNGPKATVNRVAGITGAFSRVGRWFEAAVRPLDILYRFLAAHQIIRQKHSAHASTAPAVEIEADSVIPLNKEAPLATHPAKEIAVDQKERLSISAKLVAYRRAGLVYIKKLFFKRKAELQAAHGAVARYRKAVKLKRTAKAIAADSVIMESRFNTIAHRYEAVGCSAPAEIVPEIESTFSAEHKAKARTGTAVDVNVDSMQKVKHSAKMATWLEPTVENGVLILRQVYSATQENKKLVVR